MKVLVLMMLAIGMVGCGVGKGEKGIHRGVITDVSKAGLICKTWEGQLQSGNGNSSMHYNFTIESEVVAKQLEEAQRSGKEVIVHYESPIIYSVCSSQFSNIVTKVEPYNGK